MGKLDPLQILIISWFSMAWCGWHADSPVSSQLLWRILELGVSGILGVRVALLGWLNLFLSRSSFGVLSSPVISWLQGGPFPDSVHFHVTLLISPLWPPGPCPHSN